MIDQYSLRPSAVLSLIRLVMITAALFCLGMTGTAVLRAQDGVTRVRAVHLVPDAPAVDVYLDDITPAAIAGVGFMDASRSLRMPSGTRNVKIAATGTPKEAAVINQNIAFNNDTAYTIFATGRLSTLNVAPVILTRWLGLNPTPGRSLIRVFHGSAEAGNVNITITDAIGSQIDVTDFAFRSASDYVPVPEGMLEVLITDRDGGHLYKASGIIPQGALMTVVAVGDPASKSFKLGVLFDSDSLSRSPIDTLRAISQNPVGNLRYAQVSNDLGSVNVELQGASESTGLNFRDASAMMNHPAGPYTALVTNSAGEQVIAKDVDVISEFTQTAYVLGNPAEGTADLIVLSTDGTAQPPAGKSSIRFLNAVTGFDVVNVEITFSDGSKRSISSSGFRNFYPYQTAAPGMTTVRVTTADGTEQRLMAVGTILSGAIGTLVLTGSSEAGNLGVNLLLDSDNNAQMPMILFDVITSVREERKVLSAMEVVPNPVRDRMNVRFSVDRSTGVRCGLYDIAGRSLMEADLGRREAGEHSYPVELGNIPAGTYMVVLRDDAGRTLGVRRIVCE